MAYGEMKLIKILAFIFMLSMSAGECIDLEREILHLINITFSGSGLILLATHSRRQKIMQHFVILVKFKKAKHLCR